MNVYDSNVKVVNRESKLLKQNLFKNHQKLNENFIK